MISAFNIVHQGGVANWGVRTMPKGRRNSSRRSTEGLLSIFASRVLSGSPADLETRVARPPNILRGRDPIVGRDAVVEDMLGRVRHSPSAGPRSKVAVVTGEAGVARRRMLSSLAPRGWRRRGLREKENGLGEACIQQLTGIGESDQQLLESLRERLCPRRVR